MSYPNIPAFEWAIGLFLPSMYLGSAIVHGIYNSLAIIFKFASLTIEDEKTPLNLDRKGLFEFEQGINEVLNMVRENPGKKILILINGNQRSGESRLIRNGALRQLTKEEKVGIIEEDQHEINFPIQNVHLKGMFEIITKQLASDSRVIIYDGINSFKIYSKLQYEILRSYDKELLVINLAVDKPQGFVKPEMYISVLGSSDASEVSHPREDLITISSTDRQEILKLKGFYNSLVQAKREKNWRKVKVLSSLIIRFVGRWNRNNPIDSTLYILGDSLTFIKEIDLANKANSVILCFSILEELEDYKLLEKSTDVLIKALSLTLFYLEEDTLPVKITDTPYGPRLMLDLDKMESLVKLGKFGTGKIGAPGSEKRKNFYMSLAHQVRKMSGNSGICKSISTLVVRKLLEEHGIDAVIMEKKMGEKGAHYYVQTIDGFIIDAFPLGHDYHLFERARVLGNQDIIVINKSTEKELEKNTIKEFYSSSKYQQYLTELARGKPMSSPAKDSTLPSLPGISYKKINLNMYPTDQEKYEHIYVYLADNVFKEQDMYKMKCFANIRMKYGTVIIAKDRLEVDALIKAGFTDNIVDIMVANEGHLSQFNIKDISSKIDVIIEAEKDDGRKVRLDMIEKLDSSLARSILSGV